MPAPARSRARRASGDLEHRGGGDRRTALARVIKRRATVSWWLGVVLAVGFAVVVTPAITAEHWLLGFHAGTATEPGTVTEHHAAPFTVRAPMLVGEGNLRVGGGVVVARGETATRDEATIAGAIAGAVPHGPVLYAAFFVLLGVLATLFTHHMRRSTKGRLVRVQIVSLVVLAVLAVAVKIVMLSTALSALAVPVAALALIPTMVLDRTVGLATGVLGALVVSLLVPFDVGLAILLLVQAAAAGLVVAEHPRRRGLAALTAGLVTTLCSSATYLLLTYLTTGHAPELRDPLHSPWLAAAIGPALAALIAVPLIPIYQLLVGEITQGKLFALEDLGHPLLRQIAEKSPGTWQHSLMMANMAEIAANEIGASGRLVRVGAYFHDLGKSLQAKYFIENLEPGETSQHDQLPPEVSCDAIFAHVTEGIVSARRAGLHERIIDFMHMHHGNGVLEYFWAKCREQGNPHDLTIEDFRYPGHPPQSRETAILAICDAVEAASRTLKKPDAAAIDALVQRIVYGKLHLGQLDESGLSMSDLRRISDSLRETIRHANHGRIEYPWQKAGQDASASVMTYPSTSPRLDSLDRRPGRDSAWRPQASLPASTPPPAPADNDAALATTADVGNPASEQRIPIAQGTLPEPEAADRGAMSLADAVPRLIREVPITLTGRAPGPLPPPPEPVAAPTLDREPPPPVLTFDNDPPPAVLTFDNDPPPAALTFDNDPPPAALTFDNDPLSVAQALDSKLPSTTQIFGSPQRPQPPQPQPSGSEPPRTRAATRPPAQARPPTAPPPLASRRATGEVARTAGPPAPVDLDNAITNPPPLRRGPSGHPPVPADPAQLAASLASTVARAMPASPGPPPPEEPPRTGPRHADLDSAITNPPPLGNQARTPVRHADLDSAITNPPPLGKQARTPAPRADLEDAIGEPPASTGAPHADLAAPMAPAAPLSAPVRSDLPHAAPPRVAPQVPPGTLAAPPTAGLADSAITMPSMASEPPAPRTTDVDIAPPVMSSAPAPAPVAAPAPTIIRPRASTSEARPASRLALLLGDEARVTAARAAAKLRVREPASIADEARAADEAHVAGEARVADEARVTDEQRAVPDPDLDAGVTEPSLPLLAVGDVLRIDLPPVPAASAPSERKAGWASGLAARIDAALDSDEWNLETPVVAPTKAELRALLGQPDPTRQQPVDEIALLQRHALELEEPALLPRRAPHPTTEVDPDDIEAAIEIAPHVRRPPNAKAIGVSKPKKSE